MSRDIKLLHPELQVIIKKFEANCKAAGLNVLITETFRTVAEQDALYAQGRTKPGNIVTGCKGSAYESAHQWGVSFDICRNVKGQEYSDNDGFFAKCGAIGKQLGLAWGGDWKGFVDKPHFEIVKYLPNNSTTTLKKQYGTPDAFKKTWRAVDEEMLTTMKISGGDKPIKEIPAILNNSSNYAKVRDFVDEINARLGLGITLAYDENTKVITVKK